MFKTLEKIENVEIVSYNDFPVRITGALLAALLIVSFDEPENWYDLLRLPAFYPAVFASTIMAFIIIETVFRINRWLDRVLVWFTKPARRLLLQLLLCVLLPITISVLLATLYYGWYNYSLNETVYFDKHFMPIVIMVISANLYYALQFTVRLLIHLLSNKSLPTPTTSVSTAITPIAVPNIFHEDLPTVAPHNSLIMPNGLSLEAIDLVFSLNRNIWVLHDGEKTSWLNTIQKTMLALPADQYFLANKSCIVKRSNILAAYYYGQRRILLHLHTNKLAAIYIGRNHKTKFIAWYGLEIYSQKSIPDNTNLL